MIFGRVVWAALWCGREIVGAGCLGAVEMVKENGRQRCDAKP